MKPIAFVLFVVAVVSLFVFGMACESMGEV